MDAAGMPAQDRTSPPGGNIPELDSATVRASRQGTAIGRERQARNQSFTIAKRRELLPARHVPESESSLGPKGGKKLAVGRKAKARDGEVCLREMRLQDSE